MSVSAEMYIVISLMFAVFAAVAAIGSSIVLGVGFERLRAGFEIIKKQTGFFADAIHKLDERTNVLQAEQHVLKEAVAGTAKRVEKVEKQTTFFFDSLHSLEAQILKGSPAEKSNDTSVTLSADSKPVKKRVTKSPTKKKTDQTVWPQLLAWTATSEARRLLQPSQDIEKKPAIAQEKSLSHSLTSSIFEYLLNDNRSGQERGVIYH